MSAAIARGLAKKLMTPHHPPTSVRPRYFLAAVSPCSRQSGSKRLYFLRKKTSPTLRSIATVRVGTLSHTAQR
jgi:hypothetical protein